MRRPKRSKKSPSLRTIRSALTLSCSSTRRRRAVALSIGPPPCALVAKKAAPFQSRSALSNMILISPQPTSPPITCKKVERRGITLPSPIAVRMTSTVNSRWRWTMAANQSSNSVGWPALAFDKRHLRHILLEQNPERPLIPDGVPALEGGERARDRRRRRLLRRRAACKDRPDHVGKAGHCFAAAVALAIPAEFGAQRRQSAGKRGLLGGRRGHRRRHRPHQI